MDDDEDILQDAIDPKDLIIFDRETSSEVIPKGFTSSIVAIDAKPASSLNWNQEIQDTEELIKNGYKVCFELNLDLFTASYNQARLQSVILAIDEFRSRILERFFEHTVAVILYRSQKTFASIEERDVQMDILDLLRQELPDNVCVLLLFDCSNLQDPYSFIRMFAPDRFSLFTLCLTNAPLFFSYCGWNKGNALLGYIGRDISHYLPQECSKGLVMPKFSSNAETIKPLLDDLIAQKEHFKIISEDLLALEWAGLDELYVQKAMLAPSTLRLIEGFAAAGGTVIIDQNHTKGL